MKRDHSKLICDVSEIAGVFTNTADLGGLLQKIVEMIAVHMDADVCSIYLFYEDSQELVLKATCGLDSSSIGRVSMKIGDGLTGVALRDLRPVCEGNAASHPDYRHFEGTGEEKYPSFMAVPILRGRERIGVMTLQSRQKDYFSEPDVNVFRAITSQLATTVEMANLLIAIERARPESPGRGKGPDIKFVKGLVGAEGLAVGEALVIARNSLDELLARQVPGASTLEDFRRAVAATEQELEQVQQGVEEKLADVASLIFSAQILMLKDRSMLGAMEELVGRGLSPADAVKRVVSDYVNRFDRMGNAYVREKKYDVLDVGLRLLDQLAGEGSSRASYESKIVIARELLPSDILKLSSRNVAGVVLLSGGVTSHAAVLSRSLNIPLVIADDARLLSVELGTRMILDGALGNIYVSPDDETLGRFREKEALRIEAAKTAVHLREETYTTDGVRVHLLANINLLGDLSVARDYKAEGVGLYRTEFPFMIRSDFPTEEEQFVIYRRFVESLKGREMTFRTLDIGGDKMLSYYDYSNEANPFLGMRSIRFSLKHLDIFSRQLRAILRAGFDSEIRIMFPMISSLDDFDAARGVVADCLAQLGREGRPHQKNPRLGVMIELPSAVEISDGLAREADFFSVGTNDLIQYMLAVDRTNEKVADLYLPYHPSVLRALGRVAEAALRHKRDISVCGDMAHDPRYIFFLLGLGIRKFSLDARYLPKVQQAVMSASCLEAADFSRRALAVGRVAEAKKLFETGILRQERA